MSLEAIRILKQRDQDSVDYHPERDDDGRRVVVSVGSGGMSGSIACGALEVLDEEGYLRRADVLIGSSIGGVVVTYAAIGRLKDVEETFVDPLTKGRFMADGLVRRVVSYADYKLDKTGAVPAAQNMTLMAAILRGDLNTEDVRKSKVPVVASITTLPSLDVIHRDLRELDDDQMIDFLTRGCAFPFVSGDYKGVRGIADMAIDGAFTLLASEKLALTQNPTNILSIALSPYREWSYGPWKRIARRMTGQWLAHDTGFGRDIYKRFVEIGDEQASYLGAFRPNSFILEGALVERVYPPDDPNLPGQLTMDPDKLRRGFKFGQEGMRAVIANL